MSKVSDDPRIFLKEAIVLADQVFSRPKDRDAAIRLASKVMALDEALTHGSFKLVRR
jgi:hypothetical protein